MAGHNRPGGHGVRALLPLPPCCRGCAVSLLGWQAAGHSSRAHCDRSAARNTCACSMNTAYKPPGCLAARLRCCRKLLRLCEPYNGEDLVWHPVTRQMNVPSFQVGGACLHAEACLLDTRRFWCCCWPAGQGDQLSTSRCQLLLLALPSLRLLLGLPLCAGPGVLQGSQEAKGAGFFQAPVGGSGNGESSSSSSSSGACRLSSSPASSLGSGDCSSSHGRACSESGTAGWGGACRHSSTCGGGCEGRRRCFPRPAAAGGSGSKQWARGGSGGCQPR